ncbi:MAG: hypothetical protein LUC22_07335 [Prevotella sp.]|nr:hypothetical protein [Prevotella sp.]
MAESDFDLAAFCKEMVEELERQMYAVHYNVNAGALPPEQVDTLAGQALRTRKAIEAAGFEIRALITRIETAKELNRKAMSGRQ